MPYSVEEKKRVLARVHRIRGQVEALELALSQDEQCRQVLQQIAAIRGAVNALMAEVLESHLRQELVAKEVGREVRLSSIDDAISLIRTYLR